MWHVSWQRPSGQNPKSLGGFWYFHSTMGGMHNGIGYNSNSVKASSWIKTQKPKNLINIESGKISNIKLVAS